MLKPGATGRMSPATQYRDGRDRKDLQHIDAEYRLAVRARDLQCRDACAFAGEIAAHAIADANTGDHQCGEADKCQELPHAFNEAPCSRRAV